MEHTIQRALVRYAVSKESASDPTTWRTAKNRVVLIRSDNHNDLGIVSEDYKVVQPREILEFFRDLVGAAGFTLETAGTLYGGKRMWALANIGVDAQIADSKDRMKAHLLLSTACDGSMATEGRYVMTRVVCNNTLGMARREGTPKVKINHRSRFDPKPVKLELGIEAAMTTFDRTIAAMRELAKVKMTAPAVIEATATLLHPDYVELDAEKQDKVRRSQPVETIGRLALDGEAIGSDLGGVAGTAWGWLNSVTEYVDHQGRARTVDNRLNSAWFGKGAELKERAYVMATDLLGDVIAATPVPMPPMGLLDAVIDQTGK